MLVVAAIFALLIAAFLHWGGYLIEASDALPDHVDAAVVLQGPMAGERARLDKAIALVQQGSAERVALSIPKHSTWDEEVAPVAQSYLQKTYGPDLAGKVDLCETQTDASAKDEAAGAEHAAEGFGLYCEKHAPGQAQRHCKASIRNTK